MDLLCSNGKQGKEIETTMQPSSLVSNACVQRRISHNLHEAIGQRTHWFLQGQNDGSRNFEISMEDKMAKMSEDERIQQAQKKSLQMGQLKQLLKVQLRCLSMSLGLLLLA